MAGDQRLGQDDVEVVLVVAALVAHREHVAEALGGDQGGTGAFALDHRVGGEGGAVHEDGDVRGGQAGGEQNGAHAFHHPLFGCGRGGQNLDGGALARIFDREVGESAADIDGEAS